jgi:FixJ family two-component response regulator
MRPRELLARPIFQRGGTGVEAARQRHVAVVDDDAGVRDSLRFLLESVGHSVATYASADHYLADGAAGPASCLVVDQHMPEITGLELLAMLRGRGTCTRALLITGSLTPEVVSRAAELGVAGVLEKPLDADDLLGFIDADAR